MPDNKSAKTEDTIAFLRHLRKQLRRPLTICWDRGRIHDHLLTVRKWLSEQQTIETERFPAYAPELNPDEYVWSHTKYAKLCNYAAPSLQDLRSKVEEELRELRNKQKLLKSFIHHAKLKWNNT